MVHAINGIHCDPCIAPLVKALNEAGLPTVASCCGHGFMHGWIALKDGRQVLVAQSLDEARLMDKVATRDINGTPTLSANIDSLRRELEERDTERREALQRLGVDPDHYLGDASDYQLAELRRRLNDWLEHVARDARQRDLASPERSTLWGVYWTVHGILHPIKARENDHG